MAGLRKRSPSWSFRFRLIPRNEDFYGHVHRAGGPSLRVGGGLLEEMLARDPVIWDKADEIKEVEHKCDHLTHQIIQRLNTHFRDPHRPRRHPRAGQVARRCDGRDRRVSEGHPALQDRDRSIRRAGAGACGLAQRRSGAPGASRRSRNGRASPQRAVEINRLENEADRIHEEALRRLFDEERDPVMIIKWKEILDFLEDATDRCEDVANLLEGVVVKNA